MCPWVGPHAPSFGRQLWGLLSCVEYLSPQGVGGVDAVDSIPTSNTTLCLPFLPCWHALYHDH